MRREQKAHATTLLDIAHTITNALTKLTMSQEAFKAQRAAAVLERTLEELVETLR